eukprot:scaffold123247_cov18-Tisochrysis_lutea.AAC.1
MPGMLARLCEDHHFMKAALLMWLAPGSESRRNKARATILGISHTCSNQGRLEACTSEAEECRDRLRLQTVMSITQGRLQVAVADSHEHYSRAADKE